MFLYRCKHIERFSNVHEGAFKKEHNDNNERSDTIDKWRDINHILITQAVTSTRKSSKLNNDKIYCRARGHSQFSCKYRGAAYSKCNSKHILPT